MSEGGDLYRKLEEKDIINREQTAKNKTEIERSKNGVYYITQENLKDLPPAILGKLNQLLASAGYIHRKGQAIPKANDFAELLKGHCEHVEVSGKLISISLKSGEKENQKIITIIGTPGLVIASSIRFVKRVVNSKENNNR